MIDEPMLSPRDRWRLILGQEREKLAPRSLRAAVALDELYGTGRGEGSHSLIGGGSEASYPSTREWAQEVEAIFGQEVCQEVLGRAAVRGQSGALFELEPERALPSIELLEQLLSLKGGLSEERLSRLRPLVDRVVRALVDQLATAVRPALAGSVVARPTRRRGGPLDLRRTVAANLRHVDFREDGSPRLAPDTLIFKTRARRSLNWRVILVVDVSSSMEPSVIYSALMAAILSALPAVSTHFVAFSTEVVDLTDRVSDPLGLLLEIQVGGGTNIAGGLQYARQLVSVPARTLVLLISDFEEGGPLGGLITEVRALAESGAHPLGLAALDDRGAPRYSTAVAEAVVAAGMPVAAMTPLELAGWIGRQIRR